MEIKKMVVPFEVKEFSEEDDFFTFKGYASTFGNVDRGGDVIVQGAFADSINEMKQSGDFLPAIWQHSSDTPVGIYTAFDEDVKGLLVEGKLPKADTFVSGRVIPQMKIGSVRKLSIGYSVWMDGGSFEIRDDVRYIKKLKLWEVSLVTIPMNNEANITEIKSLDFKSLSDRELEGLLKSGVCFSSQHAKVIISALKATGLRDGDLGSHRDGDDWSEVITKLKNMQQELEENNGW